jgi:HEPN domain-containing protein
LVDSKRYNEWFLMAKKDIRSARILHENDADNEVICLHCQQALEKYLKGCIIFVSRELKEGHSLLNFSLKSN